jgi:hypothetical protein
MPQNRLANTVKFADQNLSWPHVVYDLREFLIARSGLEIRRSVASPHVAI